MSLTDQRLREVLAMAASQANPSAGAVDGARQRGAALRRRRRLIAVAGMTVVLLAVGVVGVWGPPRLHDARPAQSPPTAAPLATEMLPLGPVEVLWSGVRFGQSATDAGWFDHRGYLCVGQVVEGGYTAVSCTGGEPSGSTRAGLRGWIGAAAGISFDGQGSWYLLRVGRDTSRVTVTLADGAVLEAALHLTGGSQTEVLAMAVAPHGATATLFTAYDGAGHEVDTATP